MHIYIFFFLFFTVKKKREEDRQGHHETGCIYPGAGSNVQKDRRVDVPKDRPSENQ